jgi:hypothetical protein
VEADFNCGLHEHRQDGRSAQAGRDARVPANEDELNHQFIPIAYSETLDDGSIFKVRGGDLNEFANKVGLEFMSLEGFVSCVLQTMRGAVEVAKSKVRDAAVAT